MLKSFCGEVEWANLDAIDLSKAKTLEGRKGLVGQVHDAMKNDGFLFVTNHGVTPEQVSFYVKPVLNDLSYCILRCLGCLIYPITLSRTSATKKNRNMWET
jgi:hypothetical protein